MRTWIAAAVGCVLTLAVWSASSHAAAGGGWSPEVAYPERIAQALLAGDGGHGVLVDHSSTSPDTRIWTVTRHGGRTKGAVLDPTSSQGVQGVTLAAGSGSRVLAAWDDFVRVAARWRTAGGHLGPVIPLDDADGDGVRAVVDGRGTATIVWVVRRSNGSNPFVPGQTVPRMRQIRPDGTLSPARDLSAGVRADAPAPMEPKPGVDRAGRVTIVFAAKTPAGYVTQLRRVSAKGTLGPAITLSRPGLVGVPDVGVRPDGTALVAWTEQTETLSRAVVIARPVSSRGHAGRPITITDRAGRLGYTLPPAVLSGPHGPAAVTWTSEPQDGATIGRGYVRWVGRDQRLSRGYLATSGPALGTIDGQGTVTLLSQSDSKAVRIPPGGRPGAARAIGTAGSLPGSFGAISASPDGHVLAGWTVQTLIGEPIPTRDTYTSYLAAYTPGPRGARAPALTGR